MSWRYLLRFLTLTNVTTSPTLLTHLLCRDDAYIIHGDKLTTRAQDSAYNSKAKLLGASAHSSIYSRCILVIYATPHITRTNITPSHNHKQRTRRSQNTNPYPQTQPRPPFTFPLDHIRNTKCFIGLAPSSALHKPAAHHACANVIRIHPPCHHTRTQQTTRDGEDRSPRAYDHFCLVVGVPSTPSSRRPLTIVL